MISVEQLELTAVSKYSYKGVHTKGYEYSAMTKDGKEYAINRALYNSLKVPRVK